MRFFSFDEIRTKADCAKFATDIYGAVVHGGRCNAAWRQGDNPEAVAINKESWFDHVEKSGGGILQLAMFKCGDIQSAQEFLGDYYHLTPKTQTGAQPTNCRHDDLVRQGFREVARYNYRDTSGNIIHFVARLEHPEHKKQFCQGTPEGWGVKGVTLIPYNLKAITDSLWCCIVEGEKSADCLIHRGIPATTFCGGAKKWDSSYAEVFRGKQVCLMPDNDDPGREHAQIVAAGLAGIAAEIRIVATSPAPKGDIYNYLVDEGHTIEDVYELIQAAPLYVSSATLSSFTTDTGPTSQALTEAKTANAVPFRNFIQSEVESPGRGGKPQKKITQEPRTHAAMLEDLSKRFLGFPRKQGDKYLFDHDRDTGEIIHIHDSDDLLAWIGRRSKHPVGWAHGDSMISQRQFYSSLEDTAHRYESISLIPSWPRRMDVYYAHDQLPPPCPDRSRFETLLNFFCPSSPIDRHLLAAFVCAPLWYIPGIPRPGWVIDSTEGKGCGKTTLVELVAQLYGHAPLNTTKQELSINLQQIVKRCVSHSGRQARIFLVDNVTGNFESEELSYLITTKDITGMAPYGHGEETRPNDMTYVITSNTASVDGDLAHRFFYIQINRPKMTLGRSSWKTNVLDYIEKHRFEIVSDIISMLANHQPFPIPPNTRFPEFETTILQPCCGSMEATVEALEHLLKSRIESNIDEEQARAIIDLFNFNLEKLGLHQSPCFLKSNVVNSWGGQALRECHDFKGLPIQHIRNLAKTGILPKIDIEIRRWPTSSKSERWSGLAWNITDTTEQAYLIDKKEREDPTWKLI